MRTLHVLIVLAALTGAAGADDLDEVRRLDKEISVATWTGDALWFEQHLADDYVLTTPNGALRSKQDVIKELAMPGLKMEAYEPMEVQIRLYGETAIVTGRMLQRFLLGRIRYANDLRYTSVWIKRKGSWLLAGGHTSSMAAKR